MDGALALHLLVFEKLGHEISGALAASAKPVTSCHKLPQAITRVYMLAKFAATFAPANDQVHLNP
jgi:hypothetical protein